MQQKSFFIISSLLYGLPSVYVQSNQQQLAVLKLVFGMSVRRACGTFPQIERKNWHG
jgi:hypothetical protein